MDSDLPSESLSGHAGSSGIGADMDQDRRKEYWRRNLRLVFVLLTIWFVVSYGCGILFVEQLNQVRFGGFKLGFWFAQQGAIYVFVILIFVYVRQMNKLDKEFGVEEDDE